MSNIPYKRKTKSIGNIIYHYDLEIYVFFDITKSII